MRSKTRNKGPASTGVRPLYFPRFVLLRWRGSKVGDEIYSIVPVFLYSPLPFAPRGEEVSIGKRWVPLPFFEDGVVRSAGCESGFGARISECDLCVLKDTSESAVMLELAALEKKRKKRESR